MIRRCTEADIPFVMEMGKRFADDAGVTELVGWDDASVEALLRLMIADHILLRGEKSMIGGLVFAHPFNNARVIFQEMFWRSEGREGLALLTEAERLAKEMGASRSYMLAIDTMPRAETIYRRRGYVPAERAFIKEI